MKTKVKGATLIEAIVSMMIILMVFVMFIMVYTNVMSSDNGPKRLKATSIINNMVNQTYSNMNYTDTLEKQDNLTISRVVKPGSSSNSVLLIFKVIDKNGAILSKREEIINK